MKSLSDLIGDHPKSSNFFGKWLSCDDTPPDDEKKHRCLKEIDGKREEAIQWLSDHIIKHHVSDDRIQFFKKKYELLEELGFKEYVKAKKILPENDKVRKGNATEALLTEYIKSSTRKTLLTIYKLRFNPNVEQAIKGDDTLLFDLEDIKKIKIYLSANRYILPGVQLLWYGLPACTTVVDIRQD